MRISPKEIQKSYAVLKGVARRHLNAGRLNETMDIIRHCVVLAQQFNWIYADADLEQMEKEIGERLLPHCIEDYKVDNNRVVIFDDFCATCILSIQYIEALLKTKKEVLLIAGMPNDRSDRKRFFEYVFQLKGLKIANIFQSGQQQIIDIYQTIIDFHPSQILLHNKAFSPITPVLYRLPKQIKSYLINLADQTFWLGAGAIDYCIEFRPFGATVSLERRGLRRDQLLMLPFYPIYDKNPFEGFPKETEGHITIFSGGDLYKTLDSRRGYWNLIRRLLNTYPDVRFLFATKINPLGDKAIEEFVKTNHFEDKFIYVGFRKDIYECLGHCDIYMGTCPTSGSLMSQLAAINAKPILQYYYPGTPDDETEQAVCVNEHFPISFYDEEAFMHEAGRLIADVEYRKQQGKRLQQAMIQPEQFNKALESLLATNQSPFPVETREVDYKILDERWYEQERCGLIDSFSYVYGLLKETNSIKRVPSLFMKKQIRTLKAKISHYATILYSK